MPRRKQTSRKRQATDPQAATDESPVRRKVQRHLRDVLRATAATSAAFGLVACESSSNGGGGYGGDVVCDPLPPPLVCTDDPDSSYFRQWINWGAEWDATGGPDAVRVDLTIHLYGADGELTFSADPEVTGASLGAVDRQQTTLSFYFTPDGAGGAGGAGGGAAAGGAGGSGGAPAGGAGGTSASGGSGGAGSSTTVGLVVPLSCNGVAEQLRLRLDARGPATPGATVPIEVDE